MQELKSLTLISNSYSPPYSTMYPYISSPSPSIFFPSLSLYLFPLSLPLSFFPPSPSTPHSPSINIPSSPLLLSLLLLPHSAPSRSSSEGFVSARQREIIQLSEDSSLSAFSDSKRICHNSDAFLHLVHWQWEFISVFVLGRELTKQLTLRAEFSTRGQ